LQVRGERIMARRGSLNLLRDFFGADEAITNFQPDRDPWVATLMFCGTNRHDACEKRNRSIAELARRLEIRHDPSPIA
jgi:pyrrolysine biosynthesis protein PylC